MSDPPTFPVSRSAISLQESESGHMRFDALGGLTIAEFGRALAPANLSPKQAKALGLTMSGICGRRGSNSSRSASLTSSLVSRLQAKTATLGSTLFTLTWRLRDTPSGLPIFALRASVRRTSDSVFSSWATPNARDEKVGSRATYRERGGGAKGDSLSNQAASLLSTATGETPNGSTAETVNTARLNPALPRWLMGLPPEWCDCAATATPSARQRRKPSSKQPA